MTTQRTTLRSNHVLLVSDGWGGHLVLRHIRRDAENSGRQRFIFIQEPRRAVGLNEVCTSPYDLAQILAEHFSDEQFDGRYVTLVSRGDDLRPFAPIVASALDEHGAAIRFVECIDSTEQSILA